MSARLDNPVLTKELRTRMRGTRAYWVLFGYVMLLSVVLFFGYLVWHQAYVRGYQSMVGGDPLGRQLFRTLFIAQGILISLVTPALTAGMITIEREQRTFELLMLTMLRPREVVIGKLFSAFGFAVLLLTASLPLAGICFMLGGVSQGEIAAVYLILGLNSLFYGGLGLLFSATLRSTAVSTAAAYMATLFIFGVTGAAAAGSREVVFSAINPIGAVFNALVAPPLYRWHVPAWIPAVIVILLAALLAMTGAIHRLEEGVSERPGALRWLTYLLFCALAIGVMGNIAGSAVQGATGAGINGSAAILGGCLLVPLALLALLFCSGEAAEALGLPAGPHRDAPAPRSPLGRLLGSRLFAGGYHWAPAYVLFLYVTGAALLATSFWLARHPTWILGLDAIVAALMVVFATVACYGALARLYSTLLGSRYAAALLSLVTLGLLALLPLVSYIYWDQSLNPRHHPFWETFYLNPVYALMAIGADPRWWARSVPVLWAGQQGAWMVTVLLYLAMAGVFELWGRSLQAARRKR